MPRDWLPKARRVLLVVALSLPGAVPCAGYDHSRSSYGPYASLIASQSFVYPSLTGGNVTGLSLNGSLRQNDPDVSWASSAPGSHEITVGGVSLPDVDGYIAAHSGPYQTPSVEVSGGRTYHLDVGGVQFYQLDNTSGYSFGFRDDGSVLPVTIRVNGTAIWVFPRGAEFERTIAVEGTPADRLIIVAGPSTSTELVTEGLYPLGIHIEGGIHSPSVPVILVSNAAIAIDQHRDLDKDLFVATFLSIYGQSVGLAGPGPGHQTTWIHDPASDDLVLGPLCAQGLLPNSVQSVAWLSGPMAAALALGLVLLGAILLSRRRARVAGACSTGART